MKAKIFTLFLILIMKSTANAGIIGDTNGNRITSLKNGIELNKKRMELIKDAEKFIYIKMFIMTKDASEFPLYDALCRRSLNGLDVRLLADPVGVLTSGGNPLSLWGSKYSVEWFRKACGINFQFYSPVNALYRQHDKMIISEKMAIVGGTNFSKDYSNHGRYSPLWYDFDIALEGPAICPLQKIFNDSWLKASKLFINNEVDFAAHSVNQFCYQTESVGPSKVISIYNDPQENPDRPFLSYFKANASLVGKKLSSDGKIRIFAPYFVTSEEQKKLLIDASLNGVNVQIITNSLASIDKEVDEVHVAMLKHARKLLANGIRIFMWAPSVANNPKHAIDNVFHKKGGCFAHYNCYIGSHNFDIRGDEFSSELINITNDKEFVNDFIADFDEDLKYTEELTMAKLTKQLEEAKLFSKLASLIGDWSM